MQTLLQTHWMEHYQNYIENLVIRDAEDLEDAKDYAFLCKNNSEGNIPLDEEQQKAFEEFLGV